MFSGQGAHDTTVSHLMRAGSYVFTLAAGDRAGYRTRDVTVTVEPGASDARKFRNYR